MSGAWDANKVYAKIFAEEVNCVLGVVSLVDFERENDAEDLDDVDQVLRGVLIVLVIVNGLAYVFTAWYIGFWHGVLRRRCVDSHMCTRCLCAPVFVVSWLANSVLAVVFPIWGVKCYCDESTCPCCSESAGSRRMKENAGIIYLKSTRLHAIEDVVLDFPMFVINLYLNRNELRGFSVAFAFASAMLFAWSLYVLCSTPARKEWVKTEADRERERKERRKLIAEYHRTKNRERRLALAKKHHDAVKAQKRKARSRSLSPALALSAVAAFIVFMVFDTVLLLIVAAVCSASFMLLLCHGYTGRKDDLLELDEQAERLKAPRPHLAPRESFTEDATSIPMNPVRQPSPDPQHALPVPMAGRGSISGQVSYSGNESHSPSPHPSPQPQPQPAPQFAPPQYAPQAQPGLQPAPQQLYMPQQHPHPQQQQLLHPGFPGPQQPPMNYSAPQQPPVNNDAPHPLVYNRPDASSRSHSYAEPYQGQPPQQGEPGRPSFG